MKKIIATFLLMLCVDMAYAGVVIDQSKTHIFCGSQVEYYVDKSNLKFSDILKQTSGWQKNAFNSMGFGFTNFTSWIRFDLENKLDRDLFLTFNMINNDHVNLYILNEDGSYTEKTGGSSYPFHHREVNDKNIFFIIPKFKGMKTIYAGFKSNYLITITPEIMTGNERTERIIKAFFPPVFSHGLFAALLIYQLFLFISSKEKSYLFLALLIASFQMYDLAHDGLGYMFVWPESVFFESMVVPLSLGLMGVTSGSFIQLSVETKHKFKNCHSLMTLSISLGAILCVICFICSRLLLMTYALFYSTFTVILTICIVFYMGVIKKNRTAFFIFAAYFLFDVSNIIALSASSVALIKLMPFLNNTFLIVTVSKYIRVLFVLVFSFVVTDKISIMKKNLEISEETYRSIFNGTTEAICIFDKERYRVTDANKTMLELFKMRYHDIQGKRPDDLSATEDGYNNEKAYKIYKALLNNETIQTEWRFKKSTGEKFWADVAANNVSIGGVERLMAVIRDISDKKKAEEEKEKIMHQLTQAQKMEAVGSLAGGLAHDFNNILTGILGSSNVAQIYLDGSKFDKEKIAKYLSNIEDLSLKASDTVKHLLTITRKHELKFRPANLNRILNNVVEICLNSFPKSVRIETRYPDLPAMINADSAGLEQVFLNICVNASHAVTLMRDPSEREGGVISLKVDKQYADDMFCKKHKDAVDGINYFSVSIEDNGCGIDQGTLERIFDPFFTTKKESVGSGLGLSMAYTIINRHKGLIKVYSEKGKGTTFLIYLPEDIGSRTEAEEDKQTVIKWHGKILVIDDEDFVRQIAEEILIESGYDVMTATGGSDGIDIYKTRYDHIDLILLDMSMPGLSGLDTFRELKKINPDAKVIMSSGFGMDERVKKVLDLGAEAFIQKPYTNLQLSRAVYNALVSDSEEPHENK